MIKGTLQESSPELAREWHPTKNLPLTPTDVTTGSSKKVWWICDKGHEWEASIFHRNNGSGCPFCAGNAVCDDNCLATLNPDLAKEWHPTKNLPLTPMNVTTGSGKKVWWRCNKGHEWLATVASRSAGNGCARCSGRAVCDDNCLATLNPDIAKQWHPSLNGSLTPNKVTLHSNKKVWWQCPKNKAHEWQATVDSRSAGQGCPFCSGKRVCNGNCLATLNPDLAKEWHPNLNRILTPSKVTLNSQRKVWWLCPKNKAHEWQATIANRNHGSGCPQCSGRAVCDDNCLATLNPELIQEWHPTKNGSLTPRNVTAGSHQKVWWRCSKNKSHEWDAVIKDRSVGHGCPLCHAQISQLELRIYCELKYLFPSTKSKKNIFGNECDVYIEEIKAGVEVDGLHWHRNKYLQDKKKAEAIRSRGIILIGVKEAGLEGISNIDISYTQKDSALTVIKKILRALNEQCSLNENKKKAIDEYLQRHTIANDSEYKKLWDMLPSPLPGLSLLELNHELAKEWHPTKNGSRTPGDVTLHSGMKVWWRCNKNKAHVWEAPVCTRSDGHGCPICCGKVAGDDNCLANLNPDLAKEWHPTKNGSRTPSNITTGSSRKVWWKCSKNKSHEWQATVASRSRGRGCPKCRGLKKAKSD